MASTAKNTTMVSRPGFLSSCGLAGTGAAVKEGVAIAGIPEEGRSAVDDRSHLLQTDCCRSVFGFFAGPLIRNHRPPNPSPVGASALAKVVNDNAGILNKRGVFQFFASELAPTGVMGELGRQ
jgi:hypothetical protein